MCAVIRLASWETGRHRAGGGTVLGCCLA
jgi:hypothetical protein